MLTVVEFGPVAPARIEGLRALLDDLDADSARELGLERGLKWVLVQPGKSQWTEAQAYDLIIEHVEVPRWSLHTPALALPHPRRLLELVHLYRPSALVCRSTLLAPLAAALAGLRLRPRPARLCTWIEGSELGGRGLGQLAKGAQLRERLGARLGSGVEGAVELGVDRWSGAGLRSFDAILAAEAHGAERLRAAGIASLYVVPRGVDRSCFHALRSGTEDAPAPRAQVFVELGRGAPLSMLRELDAALCRGLRHDPRLHLHAPGRARDPALARFVEGRAHLEWCPPGDAAVRADRLRASELALLLPGIDDGSCTAIEARACACPTIVVAHASRSIDAGHSAVHWGPELVERMVDAALVRLRERGARAGAARTLGPVPDRLSGLHVELRSILHAVEAVHARGTAQAGVHQLVAPRVGVLTADAERETSEP